MVQDESVQGGLGRVAGFRVVAIVPIEPEDGEALMEPEPALPPPLAVPVAAAPAVQVPQEVLDFDLQWAWLFEPPPAEAAPAAPAAPAEPAAPAAPAAPRKKRPVPSPPRETVQRAGHCYLLGCNGKTYIGWAYDVQRRLGEHNGVGGPPSTKWARRQGLSWSLVCSVRLENQNEAMTFEAAWKRKRQSVKSKSLSSHVPENEVSIVRSIKALRKLVLVLPKNVITWHDAKFGAVF